MCVPGFTTGLGFIRTVGVMGKGGDPFLTLCVQRPYLTLRFVKLIYLHLQGMVSGREQNGPKMLSKLRVGVLWL